MNIKTVCLPWIAACCTASATAATATAPVTAAAAAPNIRIERVNMGSGLQNAHGTDNAEPVGDLGVWHVPQYLPGHPTAATIWPRVIVIQCATDLCAGYEVTPELGRGEYLFFRPVRK